MLLTFTTHDDKMFSLEVPSDMDLRGLKAMCREEGTLNSNHDVTLLLDGKQLTDDTKTLQQCGLKDGDILFVAQPTTQQATQRAPFNIDFGSIVIPQNNSSQTQNRPQSSKRPVSGRRPPTEFSEDPEMIRNMFLNSQADLAILRERNPDLASVVNDPSKFAEKLRAQAAEKSRREMEMVRMMNADMFDPEAQQAIAERIRQQNVDSQLETALEHIPESFGTVVMLYVNCLVNGHPVKAFVDSGAQMTIMSKNCAERCHVMRLIDTRWAGIAKGVGTQKIIGRIHLGQIQIGNDFLPASFSVLEDQSMDLLLGLDMLKRHQCCIDLKRNMLTIGTTGSETKFLTESELPAYARLDSTGAGSTNRDSVEDREMAEALQKSVDETRAEGENIQGTSANTAAATNSFNPSNTHQNSSKSKTLSLNQPNAVALDTQQTTSSAPGPSQTLLSSAGSEQMTLPPGLPTQQTPQNSEFSEQDLAKIMQYGFSREKSLNALIRHNGNVDASLAYLFAQSFSIT